MLTTVTGTKIESRCGFDLNFPNGWQCWIFFTPLLASYSSFEKYLFSSFAHFLVRLLDWEDVKCFEFFIYSKCKYSVKRVAGEDFLPPCRLSFPYVSCVPCCGEALCCNVVLSLLFYFLCCCFLLGKCVLHLWLQVFPLCFLLAVLKFQILYLGLWSILKWCLYRVRDKKLLSIVH